MRESIGIKSKGLDLIDEIENAVRDTRDVELIRIACEIRVSLLKMYMDNILTGKSIEIEDTEVEKLKS